MAGEFMTCSFKAFCVLVALLTLKPADSALKAALRGRLAHMLCMQYELEQNFSTPPPPHRKPLYRAPDAPCRNIHWQECSSGGCEKFLSVDKYPCEEEPSILAGEYSEDLYQGDIVNKPKGNNRAGNNHSDWRWPNKSLTLQPHIIAPVLYYIIGDNAAPESIYHLEKAIQHIQACTCIHFELLRQAPQEDYFILVFERAGCFTSNVGRAGGEQILNLGPRCGFGTAVHELLHIIGFYHEHSRPDRDDYIEIIEENIRPGLEHGFDKIPSKDWDSFNESYDYSSIMHYSWKAFGDGNQTIKPKNESVRIGQRRLLSKSDVIQINKMYGCATNIDPRTCKTFTETVKS